MDRPIVLMVERTFGQRLLGSSKEHEPLELIKLIVIGQVGLVPKNAGTRLTERVLCDVVPTHFRFRVAKEPVIAGRSASPLSPRSE